MRTRLWLVFLAFVGFACATPAPQPLVDARAAVDGIERDSEVNRHASVQVREAQQALERANRSWAEEGDVEEAVHLAYLAKRRAEIARSAADGAQALENADRLTRERDKVRLEARTTQAELATETAQKRAHEAEVARGEAEAARGEAEAARAQAEAARAEAETASELERKLREEIAELQARETERGLLMTLGDVLFDVDKDTLKPGAMNRLDRLVDFLNEYSDRSVLIEGHTDATGSDAYNLELSQRRAEAVATYLVSHGIARTRLFARGYGKAYPVAGNDDSAGRQQNRRVEIVILRPGDDPARRMRPPAS